MIEKIFDFYLKYADINDNIIDLETNEIVTKNLSISLLDLPSNIESKLLSRRINDISKLILVGNSFLRHNGFTKNDINELYDKLFEFLTYSKSKQNKYELEENDSNLEMIEESDELEENDSNLEMIEELDELELEDDEFWDDDFTEDENKSNKIINDGIKLSQLNLSVRAYNCLKSAGYNYLEEIVGMKRQDLIKIKNMGQKSVREILDVISLNIDNSSKLVTTLEKVEKEQVRILLEDLNLSMRTYNCLRRAKYEYLDELLGMDQYKLAKIRNMGKKSVKEILNILDTYYKLVKIGNPTTIDDLDLSIRTYRCLKGAGLINIIDINNTSDEELLKIRSFGVGSLDEIRNKIKDINRIKELINKTNETYKFDTPKYLLFLKPENLVLNGDNINLKTNEYFVLNVNLESIFLDSALVDFLNRNNFYKVFDLLNYGIDNLMQIDFLGKTKWKKIYDMLVLYLKNNLIDELDLNDNLKKIIKQKVIMNVKETNFSGIERITLIESLSSQYPKDFIVEAIENLVLDHVLFIYEGDKLFYRYDSYPSYVYRNKKGFTEREYKIIFDRLDGLTLEEIGLKYGVARERIRQIAAKMIKRTTNGKTFREDRFQYLYEKYNFNRDTFNHIFLEKERTFNYLAMRYTHGKIDYKEAINDENIPKRLRACIFKHVEKCNKEGKFEDDGVWISKKHALDYYISKYVKNSTKIEDIYNDYIDFAKKYDLEFADNLRNFDAKIQRLNNCISSSYKRKRFYDFYRYDFDLLIETINLDSYANLQISTKILFDKYPDLMSKYDIRDMYELHNVLRKINVSCSYKIDFGKMPSITIGEFDKREFLLSILEEHGEIRSGDFAKLIAERLGVDAQGQFWLSEIDEYREFGKFVYRNKVVLTNEQIIKIKELLPNTIYFKEEVYKICKENFNDFDTKILDRYNFNLLGFNLNGSYIVKKPYTASSYFKELLNKDEIIDLNNYSDLLKLSSFTDILYDMRYNYDLIEFEPRNYISIRRLEKAGITKQDIYDYINSVNDFVNDDYFSLKTLKNNGFYSELEDLGFDEIFYEAFLRNCPKFYSTRFANIYVFKKTDEPISRSIFIADIIKKYRMIERDDLINLLKKEFGIKTDFTRINELINGTGIYYNSIMDTFYADYETFVEEI